MELWAMDEHRLGLKPVYRRVWAPLAWVRPRYRWLYVYGFVRPSTGESEFWLLPTVNAAVFSEVLRQFARLRGSGGRKGLLVVLDRAGWHVSRRVEVPEGVGLVFLPPYSPELQPVERVWPLVDGVVANGRVDSEEELWERVEARCAYLQTQPELIRSHTLFHWWPGGC
ncbi:transposase [Thermus scotoductus]|uniref:Transposase n=1 Tax=Thermus scotoductus TaxID=37636 RepID=A0A0N0IR67_THESC|nr:transposase [Thermus scotoductus]